MLKFKKKMGGGGGRVGGRVRLRGVRVGDGVQGISERRSEVFGKFNFFWGGGSGRGVRLRGVRLREVRVDVNGQVKFL